MYNTGRNLDLLGSRGTSSGTFDTPGAISYTCSIVTESLSPTVFDIFSTKIVKCGDEPTDEPINQQTRRIAILPGGADNVDSFICWWG